LNEEQGLGPAKQALAVFADAVTDAEWRARFAKDPDGALAERNVAPGDIPDNVMDFLKSLSEEELQLVGRLGSVMIDAGLYERMDRGVLFWHF
jgi:hypothetical protein